MIATFLSLFSSSGMGVLLGHVFGWLNRREDAKESAAKRRHELDLRDKDREQITAEWQARSQIAAMESSARVQSDEAQAGAAMETAWAAAQAAAHAADRATYQGVWGGFVDGVRGMVRPVLTFMLVVAALCINCVLLWLLTESWPELDKAEKLRLSLMTLEWTLFQASSAVGFWFGSRPTVLKRK